MHSWCLHPLKFWVNLLITFTNVGNPTYHWFIRYNLQHVALGGNLVKSMFIAPWNKVSLDKNISTILRPSKFLISISKLSLIYKIQLILSQSLYSTFILVGDTYTITYPIIIMLSDVDYKQIIWSFQQGVFLGTQDYLNQFFDDHILLTPCKFAVICHELFTAALHWPCMRDSDCIGVQPTFGLMTQNHQKGQFLMCNWRTFLRHVTVCSTSDHSVTRLHASSYT